MMGTGIEKKDDEAPRDSKEGRDRRLAPRVLVHLEVDYGNEDTFLFAYMRDISATGIFVRTNSPEPPGTELNVRFTPQGPADADTDAEPLELEGEVIWVNEYRPGDRASLNPGMGIRFVGLTREQRARLSALVKRFAYLDS